MSNTQDVAVEHGLEKLKYHDETPPQEMVSRQSYYSMDLVGTK